VTEEGYPDEEELEAIEKWPVMEVFTLIRFVSGLWQYRVQFEDWRKGVFHFELHTGGWSGNESIIEALEKNRFVDRFCVKWLRGGHWYFEIDPRHVGFMPVSELAKKKGISRQWIHKESDSYDWLKVGNRNFMVRERK
jgi:hypothetical protein